MEQSAMRTRRKGSAGAPEPARDAGRELKPLRSLCGREKERRTKMPGWRRPLWRSCETSAWRRRVPVPGGRPVVGHLYTVEMRPRTVPGIVADPHLGHPRASAWYGQQGEHFVAVDHRRCIRMPFVPPCLMYNLSILQKDVQQRGLRVKSSVNGTKGAKHTASKTSLYASDERTPVGRAATMGCKLCRSSQKWRRSFCSSAFGRATSGAAVPRPYLKATK